MTMLDLGKEGVPFGDVQAMDAAVREEYRRRRLARQLDEHPSSVSARLVEASGDFEGAGLEVLEAVVRGFRRSQPSRTKDGSFGRRSERVHLGRHFSLFVLWAAFGDPPSSPATRGERPIDDPDSWFAQPKLWWAPVKDRMACIFLDASCELPFLAFEPFDPNVQWPERLFRWQLVDAKGNVIDDEGGDDD